ncbi:MAG: hypothetical protein JO142_06845 [Burkholderiales bacterium]|nr:hypothetical protein [Burkholderiales bacterium]
MADVVTEQHGVWTIPLGPDHLPYQFVRLRRRFPGKDGYTVVVVDMAKLMAGFTHQDALPPPSKWPAPLLHQTISYLNPHARGGVPHRMPFVHIEESAVQQPRLFGLLGNSTQNVPVVSFIAGRHRARYMEYAGACAMPVEVSKLDAELLRKHCGADESMYQRAEAGTQLLFNTTVPAHRG